MANLSFSRTTVLAVLLIGTLVAVTGILLVVQSGESDSDSHGEPHGARGQEEATAERSKPGESRSAPSSDSGLPTVRPTQTVAQLSKAEISSRSTVLHVALDCSENVDLTQLQVGCRATNAEADLVKSVPAKRGFDVEVPHSTELEVWLLSPTLTSERLKVSPLKPGERREVDLHAWLRAGAFWGRVVDKETGRPIARASIEFSEVNVSTYCLRADAEGYFLGSLDADGGEATIDVTAEGYESVSTGVACGASKARPFTIALARGATLTGRLLDHNGRPFESVNVTLEYDALKQASFDLRLFYNGAETHTDEHGCFRLERLSSGRPFTVTFAASRLDGSNGLVAVARQAAFVAGEHRRLDLRLDPAGSVNGRVLDQEGRAVPDAPPRGPFSPSTERRNHSE